MQNKGFTLIELLVAITIVAIMSTLGFMGIKDQIKKAKATRAISAVKETSKALELYYNDNDDKYPDSSIPTSIFQNGQVPAGVLYDGTTTGYCLYVDVGTNPGQYQLLDSSDKSYAKNVTLNCTGCSGQTMTVAPSGEINDNFCLENAQ